MARYSKEFKHKIIQMMMPPSNKRVIDVAKETGISENTLYSWKRKAKENGFVITDGETNSEKWNSEDKFHIVIETFHMNEAELSTYCREKGLYPEQVEEWKNVCKSSNGGVAAQTTRLEKEVKDERREKLQYKKELARKEAALAETAALLALRKKMHAIWGDPEEDLSAPRIAKEL